MVQSRATLRCLTLREGRVTLEACVREDGQLWAGTPDTSYCQDGVCLRHTDTLVSLAKMKGRCVSGTSGQFLYEVPDSSRCPLFSYGSGAEEFSVRLGDLCVDRFG